MPLFGGAGLTFPKWPGLVRRDLMLFLFASARGIVYYPKTDFSISRLADGHPEKRDLLQ
jgi:hypothetical protein